MSDYFAPDFKLTVGGSTLDPELLRHVFELKVVTEPDTLDHFSLKLANPFPDMRFTHGGDANRFAEGQSVAIDLGYVGDLQRLFDGEITSLSPSFPETGSPSLSVAGYSRLHWLTGSTRNRTFQDVTDHDVATRIANDLKLKPKIEKTTVTYPYVIQYNQSDLAFLLERARRIHFEVAQEVDPATGNHCLIFRRVQSDQPRAFSLVWGQPKDSVAPGDGLLPLRSFHPTMSTLRQVDAVVVRAYDSATKQTFEGTAGSQRLPAGSGKRRKEELRADHTVFSNAEAEQLAKAIYNDRALELVSGNGSTIGTPELRAGRVVEIQGLGSRFSGDYYVTQASHTLDVKGYQTSFTVRRNTVE